MIGAVAVFVLFWVWERRSLAGWSTGERAAFWAAWAVTLAWSIAVEAHLRVPTLPGMTDHLFLPLAHALLRQHPDVYW